MWKIRDSKKGHSSVFRANHSENPNQKMFTAVCSDEHITRVLAHMGHSGCPNSSTSPALYSLLLIIAVMSTIPEFWRTWVTVAAPIAALALPFTADKENEKVTSR